MSTKFGAIRLIASGLFFASVRDTRGARQSFECRQTLAIQNLAEFLSGSWVVGFKTVNCIFAAGTYDVGVPDRRRGANTSLCTLTPC